MALSLDPSYRLQITWDGQHFLLYLRSLVDGVLPSVEPFIELPYPSDTRELHTPEETVTVSGFLLDCNDLHELFSDGDPPALLGADALWLESLWRWVVGLFRDGYWYPEVLDDGVITLHPLLDAASTRQQSRTLKDSLPPSLLASSPAALHSPVTAWRELISGLTNTIGRDLLRHQPVVPTTARLPEAYQTLLDDLSKGRERTDCRHNFFDHRQANLTLKQRVSTLSFRIVCPQHHGDLWELRPQLQSIAKPEIYVDAIDAWAEPATIPGTLLPQETSGRLHLLQEFGRALRLFPVLGASLTSNPPTPLRYDDEEMSTFLAKSATTLSSFGYELLAPSGLERAFIPEVELGLDGADRETIRVTDRLDFHWHLVVGNSRLTRALIEQWQEDPRALFFDNGQWFWLDQKETLKVLRFVDKQPKQGTLLEALSLASELPTLRLDFEGSLSPLDHSARFVEMDEPTGFVGSLRDYQRRGFSWLSFMNRLGLGACLADDMGLGKTVQTLALLSSIDRPPKNSAILLVCPTSVLGNWQREAQRFAPELRVLLHHGERVLDQHEFVDQLAEIDVILTSYALLTRDDHLFLDRTWSLVILDEAQQIKNPGAKVSRLTAKLQAEHRILLTGTPVENRLQDLWSLFRFLQPELFGSKRRFQSRFAAPIEKRGDELVKRQLKRLVNPFILRRTKLDPDVASELPARVETTVECTLTADQTSLYQKEVEIALGQVEALDGFKRKGAILRLLTRLKQLCDHPALLEDPADWTPERSGKLHRLFELIKEFSPEEGVLIFSQFTGMLKHLKVFLTELTGEEVLLLDGSTPREARDQMVERFQSGSGPRIFCISLKAGGVGLNLTRASSVIHFDRWWNPAVEAQATDRAHRIGQTKQVHVFKFVTLGTLEEQIAAILHDKLALTTGLIEEGDSWLTELDDRELSDLLLPGSQEKNEVTL